MGIRNAIFFVNVSRITPFRGTVTNLFFRGTVTNLQVKIADEICAR